MSKRFLVQVSTAIMLVTLIVVVCFILYNSGFLYLNRANLAVQYVQAKYHSKASYIKTYEPLNEEDGEEEFMIEFNNEPKTKFLVEDDGFLLPHFTDNYVTQAAVVRSRLALQTVVPSIQSQGFDYINVFANTDAGLNRCSDSTIVLTVQHSISRDENKELNDLLKVLKLIQHSQKGLREQIGSVSIEDPKPFAYGYNVHNIETINSVQSLQANIRGITPWTGTSGN